MSNNNNNIDMQVIFYRNHPKEQDTHMQVGCLYKRDETGRQIIGEYPRMWTWQKWQRAKLFLMKKNMEARKDNNVIFINVGDGEIKLPKVVEQHLQFRKFCDLTGGFFDWRDGTVNRIMTKALYRSISSKVEPLLYDMPADVQSVIQEALMGGILYADRGWEGQGWKYDITSCYPSIMASSNRLPLGEPKWCHTDQTQHQRPSFILAELHGYHPLMRNTKSGKPLGQRWYTNLDLQMAHSLGLTVTLATDKRNCIKFTHSTTASAVFGKYVRTVFPVKRQAQDDQERNAAKLALNKLYGLLAKRSWRVYGKGGDCSLGRLTEDDGEIVSMIPDDEGSCIIEVVKPERRYAYPNLCVFAPFVTGYARLRLVSLLSDHIDHIKQIHTDGWIMDQAEQWMDNLDPAALGGIKTECEDLYMKVYHVNKVRDQNNEKV